MWRNYRGSSLVEILVALLILSISGMGVALVQKETEQQRELVRWRWQAQHWLAALTRNLAWQQRLGNGLSAAALCADFTVSLDCRTQACNEQQASEWQQQRVCRQLNITLDNPSVALAPCVTGMCLRIAPNNTLIAQCEEEGQRSMCVERHLPLGVNHASY